MLYKDICECVNMDPFLQHLMAELETAEDMLYKENLSAANYIHWKARKDTLAELRDAYCAAANEKNK